MWGKGYIFGIALAAIFWFFFIRPIEKNFYKKKMEIIQNRLKRKEAKKNLLKTGRENCNDSNETKSTQHSLQFVSALRASQIKRMLGSTFEVPISRETDAQMGMFECEQL